MDAPLAYHSLDNEGNLIEVNNAWLKTLDYQRADVIGKSVSKFLTPKSKDTFRTQFPKIKEEGAINSVQFEMVRSDGKIIQVSIDGIISLDDFGRFSHTHCIIQDISKRVRTELILKEHEQVLLK